MEQKLHPVDQEELMVYLDGELPADRAAVVAEHLDRCAECKPLVSELRLLSERLVEWQVEPAPERLAERVVSAMEAPSPKSWEDAKTKLFPYAPNARVRHWILGLAAATVLGLIVVAILIPNLLRSRFAVQQAPKFGGGGGGGGVQGWVVGGVPNELQSLPIPPIPSGPVIVRTASLTLYASDFDKTRNEIERVIRNHGGYAGQVNVSAYAGSARSMKATYRVPASDLDSTLGDLKKAGRVVEEALTAEEVTQQYVDLQARLANARATEQRLKDVLTKQAGRMQDVLAAEQEIARVREEIERMVAEQKNLEGRVQYAALSVTLNEEYRAGLESTSPPAFRRLRNALVDGYHGFSESVLGLIVFVFSYGPAILFWAAILFFPARFAWRRVRARAR
jgi:uncharacterized protein DUF4349/putative zinc finger protein